ncbi:MAG: S24/S26 family peptidase [Bacteriovoracaceae bacterium]|jgi:hypothetical protein|nr:S24/S26 family peptidase [Bacteriovoracaceae bacterium]
MKITKQEFHFIQQKLKNDKDHYILRVVSDSMTPFIKVGEKVEIKYENVKNLKIFDTVVFWSNGILLCHFFWSSDSENEDFFLTKSLKYRNEFDLKNNNQHLLGIVSDKNASLFLKIKMICSNISIF